jgi:uncharacterized protein
MNAAPATAAAAAFSTAPSHSQPKVWPRRQINFERLLHRTEKLTAEDAQIVADQLEITPLNLIEIGARNTVNGEPLTLVLYPLTLADTPKGRYCNGTRQPFPTIYWMSCPDLRSKISRLEHFGLGNLIQDLLNRDSIADYQVAPSGSPMLQEFYSYLKDYHQEQALSSQSQQQQRLSYLEQMRQAHHEYALERWNSFTSEDIEYIRSNGWEKALNTRVGIAGMKKFTQVKCLHTHYAHFITRPEHGNVIGRWVHEVLVREGSIPRDYCLTQQQPRQREEEQQQSKAGREEAETESRPCRSTNQNEDTSVGRSEQGADSV